MVWLLRTGHNNLGHLKCWLLIPATALCLSQSEAPITLDKQSILKSYPFWNDEAFKHTVHHINGLSFVFCFFNFMSANIGNNRKMNCAEFQKRITSSPPRHNSSYSKMIIQGVGEEKLLFSVAKQFYNSITIHHS